MKKRDRTVFHVQCTCLLVISNMVTYKLKLVVPIFLFVSTSDLVYWFIQ